MRSRILFIIAGVAVAGALLPASQWVAGAIVPDGDDTEAALTLPASAAMVLPDAALESRLIDDTTAAIEAEAASLAAAQQAAQQAAEREAAREARLEQAASERASRSATRSAAAPVAPVPAQAGAPHPLDDALARLRQCEAGGRYDINTGNGYYGAYQFTLGTWRSLGYGGYPHQAPPQVQDEAARKLQARSGWGQWPACSRRIGVR